MATATVDPLNQFEFIAGEVRVVPGVDGSSNRTIPGGWRRAPVERLKQSGHDCDQFEPAQLLNWSLPSSGACRERSAWSQGHGRYATILGLHHLDTTWVNDPHLVLTQSRL
jgi:hypothetical protein